MWDWDRFGRNQFLGEVRLSLSSLDLTDSTAQWYTLQDKVSIDICSDAPIWGFSDVKNLNLDAPPFFNQSLHFYSLVPRPRPAFRHLQYGKAGRAWYVSPHGHYVIDKWPKFSERNSEVLHIVQPTTRSTLGVYDSRPLLARYVW